MKPRFVKNFFKKFSTFLSGDRIYCLTALEADDQPVRKTHDLGAAGTHAPVHAVVIRTAGLRHTDGTISDGDGVSAAGCSGDMDLLVDRQIHHLHYLTITDDLGEGCIPAGEQQGNAQAETKDQDAGKKQDPVSGFHFKITS